MPDTLADPVWDYTVLEGPFNFLRWSRDLECVAWRRGVWDLINGTEALLEKSTMSDVDDTEWGIQKYEDLLDDFRNQQERIQTALGLARTSVSPFIHRSLLRFRTPNEMFTHLKGRFKESDSWQREAVRNRMDLIEFSDQKPMAEFIDEIVQCQLDMNDSGGTMMDEDVVHKIQSCLPEAYDGLFMRRSIVPRNEPPKLNEIRRELISMESNMREFKMREETPKKKRRPKCAGCGRWGHIHADCRVSNH